MKVVEILPPIEQGVSGYKSRSDRDTAKFSIEDIEAAIKTAEYKAVEPKECKVSIQMSPDQWRYIDEYARKEDVSMQIAIQWFWNSGFNLMRGVHKMQKEHPGAI